ncbi:uroporphyrinogen-III C-methyltransferase [Photobacterium aquimaris]|uniref:uroporphyrinogen-III C-methyltransferase n=1 Tax=Photobacterium aquimaris TaxID=512643 RepID=A0A2T3HVI7_9GAMM|nr:uroporphyrinogen-III C-methyltransferase [Photobacterium aquimaris]MCP4956707.1 uroporphyrinogen-III C-methyltransferase [Photobacterium aquimaris]OBU20120.1 uroporphyrinogen-III C-methyltransferase [Photobacterium aquimaris]PQJ41360.1 uroporphyrinogen-III C-methyltransferase [Photobacterium aquimaris]PSU02480.1 uroporphyrinogen-III C-methyltransferase [Photobacterium aquimaris]
MPHQDTLYSLPTSTTIGKVILVGAGPGDPDLLTVKAMRLIQQADVIIYDRLVSDEIIALFPPHSQSIFVGKEAGNHCVPQQQINELLVKHALAGKQVIRLKGGDPFIFGRGGEELEALLPFNIPFEVVPGITAASGCAAYAGIPLTHRDHAQSVQFITGHLKQGQDQIDWLSLARAKHTLVFYMGLNQSNVIRHKLSAYGMSLATPIAIIERGTTAQQRVLTGELAQIETLAKQAISPALIIIGSVTQLSQQLNWFQQQADSITHSNHSQQLCG